MPTFESLRIGTRSTRLALAQTEWVVQRLRQISPTTQVVVVPIATRGDKHPDQPLPQIGDKGVFTAELESALLAGQIDLAVHSAKDLAALDPQGLAILAVPLREDPHDAWLSAVGDFADLPAGASIGTSSPRRVAQLMHQRSDLNYVPLRGAVDTRLRKVLDEKQLEGLVLAVAGLKRLGLADRIRKPLGLDECVPAPGQGCLALQGRVENAALRSLLQPLHDTNAAVELACERRVVALLGAGCRTPLGVLARAEGVALHCRACLMAADAGIKLSVSLSSGVGGWMSLADRVADALQRSGAKELLQS